MTGFIFAAWDVSIGTALLYLLAFVLLGGGFSFAYFRKTLPQQDSRLRKPWAGNDSPYDEPASLNPRSDSYMRMIDPDRDRPRHY